MALHPCFKVGAPILYAVNTLLIQGLIMCTINRMNEPPENHWLKQFKETIAWEDLSAVDLTAYRQHLEDAKGLKASSVNRRIQAVKKLFACAHGAGLIGENPVFIWIIGAAIDLYNYEYNTLWHIFARMWPVPEIDNFPKVENPVRVFISSCSIK